MNGVVFAAILIDRLRISMRICAIAAGVVLVLDPTSLVGVSFQMSFGAVVALVLRGRGGYDPRGDPRHLPVFDLPLSPHRVLFRACQCHCGASERAVDPALGSRDLSADAARARASGIDPDGLGDRGNDLGRAEHIGAAGQCLGNPAVACISAVVDLSRRTVVVLVARFVAALGHGCDRGRLREHDADPATRHRYRR